MGKVVDEMLAKLHKKKEEVRKDIPIVYSPYSIVSSAHISVATTSANPLEYWTGSTLGPQSKE